MVKLTGCSLRDIPKKIRHYCHGNTTAVVELTRRTVYTISSDIQDFWRKELNEENVESVDVSIREIKKHVAANYPVERHHIMFEDLCKQRRSRVPLQYVTGEWDFRHLTLKMKSPVFIPRQETEGLLDLINNDLQEHKNKRHVNILEVGIGTGAISLSILKENTQQKVSCVALDVLEDAVELSRKNAERLGLSARFNVYHDNIGSFDLYEHGLEPFDMVVSNPPYIPSGQISGLQEEVKSHENHVALDGGADGLDVVLSILKKGHTILKHNSSVWLEVDEHHPKELQQLIPSTFPAYKYVQTYNDCFGK